LKTVRSALKKCKGNSKPEILKRASKLPIDERLAMIEYFEIEPQELASTLVLFWLNLEKSIPEHQALLGEAFFTQP